MLLAVQSQSQSLTSIKEQPSRIYQDQTKLIYVSSFCPDMFCSVCFVAGVGQVYFILSLFNSVPTNNYSFTIESENWWKSVITAIYYIYNGQNFSQTLTKPILHCSYMLPFHYTAFFALFCCTTNMLCVLDVKLSFKTHFQFQ